MTDTVVLGIDHIVKTEGVCSGDPRIAGTRLTVHSIIGQLQSGATIDDLLDGYAHIPLTRAQIHAALAYYYDHQQEIDDLLAAEDAAFQEAIREAEEVRAALSTGERFITAADAAKRLDLSPGSQQVAHLCREGKLDCKKVANRWFVTLASVDAYAASNRNPGPKPEE
jgi:uncharacterized protein (DUF433 family)